MTDDEFYEFCVANPAVRIERSPQGEIIIAPPAGGESDYHTLDVGAQLKVWSRKDGRGKAFGSSIEFILPSGEAYSPDAAWVSNERLSKLTRQLRAFPPVCPEFRFQTGFRQNLLTKSNLRGDGHADAHRDDSQIRNYLQAKIPSLSQLIFLKLRQGRGNGT